MPSDSELSNSEQADDRLLELIGEVLDVAEAPSSAAVESAIALIALRQLDGELMELLADSAHATLAHRGADSVRLLRFELSGCSIEIDAHFGDGITTAQLTPGGVSTVTMVTHDGTSTFLSDELGRFRQPIGERRPRRWRVQFPDGRVVVTPIVRL